MDGAVPSNWSVPPEIVKLGAVPAAGPVPFTTNELRIIGVAISWLATMALAAGITVPGVAKNWTAVVVPLTGARGSVFQLVTVLQLLVPVVVLVQVWALAKPAEPSAQKIIATGMSESFGFMNAVFLSFRGFDQSLPPTWSKRFVEHRDAVTKLRPQRGRGLLIPPKRGGFITPI